MPRAGGGGSANGSAARAGAGKASQRPATRPDRKRRTAGAFMALEEDGPSTDRAFLPLVAARTGKVTGQTSSGPTGRRHLLQESKLKKQNSKIRLSSSPDFPMLNAATAYAYGCQADPRPLMKTTTGFKLFALGWVLGFGGNPGVPPLSAAPASAPSPAGAPTPASASTNTARVSFANDAFAPASGA